MAFDLKYSPEEIYFPGRSVLLNDDNYLYHIREHADKSRPDYISVLREAYGPEEENELSDTLYYTPGGGKSPSFSSYHEHPSGFELFLVGGKDARCLVKSGGRQAFAYEGDLVFLPPYTPHGFAWYGNPLRWREIFSNFQMNMNNCVNWRILEFAPDAHADPAFEKIYRGNKNKINYDFPVDFEQVDQISQIIRFDGGASVYEIGGVKLVQKITRAQWWGQREIWQYHLPKGAVLSCDHYNDKELLLMLFRGSVQVHINGVEPFEAKPWDYPNIPKHLGAKLIVKEDAVFFDFCMKGYLFRAMEEIKARAKANPAFLCDRAQQACILRKNGVYLALETNC